MIGNGHLYHDLPWLVIVVDISVSSLSGDLCEAGWDATEHEQEFDQLTEEDLRW